MFVNFDLTGSAHATIKTGGAGDPAVTTDLHGRARTAPYSVGAFENDQ